MSDELVKFDAGPLDQGVKTFTPDMNPSFNLTENTTNVSMGILQGLGPRYGGAPIPGQNDTEVADTLPRGLMGSEGATGNPEATYIDRSKVFGLVPIILPTF